MKKLMCVMRNGNAVLTHPKRKWFGLTIYELEPGLKYRISNGSKSGKYRSGIIITIDEKVFKQDIHAIDFYKINRKGLEEYLTTIYFDDNPNLMPMKRLRELRFDRLPPDMCKIDEAREVLAEYRSYKRATKKQKGE